MGSMINIDVILMNKNGGCPQKCPLQNGTNGDNLEGLRSASDNEIRYGSHRFGNHSKIEKINHLDPFGVCAPTQISRFGIV